MHGKVLVIDDERDMCTLIARLLNKRGLEVEITTSTPDAVGLVEKGTYDLLIVDLKMPEINGIEFIKKVRQEGFRNTCIIITAHPSSNAMREAKKQNVFDFLIKPLDILELEEVVLRAIDAPEQKEVIEN